MTGEHLKVFNKNKLLERYQGDFELVRELCQVFLEDLEDKISRLDMSISSGNMEDLVHVAHSLKGSTGTVTAEISCEQALNLEMAARAGNLEQAREIHPNLLESLESVRKAMLSEILSD